LSCSIDFGVPLTCTHMQQQLLLSLGQDAPDQVIMAMVT
jgi:hypothetical protein